MDTEQARYNMIEQQIRPWDVLDQRVLDVLHRVHRENYVPDKYRDLAFADLRIPLDATHAMMEPKLEARILQALNIQPTDRVLEIGTGSGYLTACLAALANSVISYDIDADLSKQAGQRLADDDHANVSLRVGDAMNDLQLDEPFDVIVVTASLPVMQRRFHELLKPDGRLFIVVGEAPAMQALLITRVGEHEWSSESLFETELEPLSNTQPPSHFHL